ncbi:Hypothetical predicted protein [Mytilus galloprovincialis]|uniref:Uncharacterized protein n=1 Tax=Mytilus galloprovincialis TaxID=29158 RepID=A0A8B6FK14_MYTGA|nr:Hypothetical predicted protein [Mytilus galloprovincialis]
MATRRNNADLLKSATYMTKEIFHGRNHTKYQIIELYDSIQDRMMPDDEKKFNNNQILWIWGTKSRFMESLPADLPYGKRRKKPPIPVVQKNAAIELLTPGKDNFSFGVRSGRTLAEQQQRRYDNFQIAINSPDVNGQVLHESEQQLGQHISQENIDQQQQRIKTGENTSLQSTSFTSPSTSGSSCFRRMRETNQ